MTENTPVPPAQDAEVKPEEVAAPTTIKIANGQEVTLHPEEMAILIAFDQRTGQPAVYEVQNCPLRAYSRMLLNEALALYNTLSLAKNTASEVIRMQEEKKKPGLFGAR